MGVHRNFMILAVEGIRIITPKPLNCLRFGFGQSTASAVELRQSKICTK